MSFDAPMFDDVLATPGHLLGLAARGFVRLSEERLKPLGFSPGQLPVLVALEEGGADTQVELARVAGIKQPPMAQMIARMAKNGLIDTSRDPEDGRVTRLVLTERARSAMPDAIATLLVGSEQAMAGFSRDEVATFIEMLQRLIKNLDAMR